MYDGEVTDYYQPGSSDLAEDIQQLLREIDKGTPAAPPLAADCRPPLDVLETATSLEIVVDVPGVPADSLSVAIRRSTLLVVGTKPAGALEPKSRFHLAERNYGRFVRAVGLRGAFDGARARCVLNAGELRISLPLLEDRRGGILTIPVGRP